MKKTCGLNLDPKLIEQARHSHLEVKKMFEINEIKSGLIDKVLERLNDLEYSDQLDLLGLDLDSLIESKVESMESKELIKLI